MPVTLSRMSDVSLRGALCFAGVVLSGCGAAPYVPPRVGAPHAVVKLRLLHHASVPDELSDQLWIDDAEVALPEHGPGAPLSVGVRVAPGVKHLRARAVFKHREPWADDRDRPWPIGYCGTDPRGRPVVCTLPSAQPVRPIDDGEVIDAVCEAELRQRFEPGAVYLVRVDFYATDHCAARCLLQRFEDAGRFRFEPCAP